MHQFGSFCDPFVSTLRPHTLSFSIFIRFARAQARCRVGWHRLCYLLPSWAGTHCPMNHMEIDLLKKILTTKSIKGVFATVGLALSASTFAGATIEIDDTRSVSIGGGLRTSFRSVEDSAPSGEDRSKNYAVENMRLYMGAQVHENVKLTFNTECLACGEGNSKFFVLDAIVQLEFSDKFNIDIGRHLTPADRIEMNGPFYGLNWNQYTVPLLPSDQNPFTAKAGRYGRDDGATVWGSFDKFQYAVGVFDGFSGPANSDDNLLIAGRFAYNFLNKESNPAYYTSSTYYGGAGDVFTVALFLQSQADGAGTGTESTNFFTYGFDVLFEKVLANGAVVTLEGEFKDFDVDLTATMIADPECFCLYDGTSYFATAAYLFPQEVGFGKFQPYIRFTKNDPSDFFDSSDLIEIGVNYVISGHNARLNLNFTDGDANLTGIPGANVNALTIGVQIQI